MLPAKLRLPRQKFRARELKRLKTTAHLSLAGTPNGLKHNRFGLILSKGAVKSAVARHRILRRLRAVLQKLPSGGQDYVLSCRAGIAGLSPRELTREVLQLFA